MTRHYPEDEDREPTDPINVLRRALSKVEVTTDERILNELLYTASEHSLYGDLEGITVEDALTVARLVKLAGRLSLADANQMRM